MIIYPAIDLRQGKCIRLYQGDYARETIYSEEPSVIIKNYVAKGSTWLHLIDLDGAKNPETSQIDCITHLIKTAKMDVQTGGGIRTKAQIKYLLEQGAKRIIIGSLAVKKPEEVKQWFKYFGHEKLCLALDIMFDEQGIPKVAIDAWQTISEFSLDHLIDYYRAVNLTHMICTNIALDGTLKGPDFKLYQTLLKKFPFIALQASGGIQSLADIIKLREMGLSGAIIGRALYENNFTLDEVINAC